MSFRSELLSLAVFCVLLFLADPVHPATILALGGAWAAFGYAVATDVEDMRIENAASLWMTVFVLVAAALSPVDQAVTAVMFGGVMAAVGVVLWAFGGLGGGDAKILPAVVASIPLAFPGRLGVTAFMFTFAAVLCVFAVAALIQDRGQARKRTAVPAAPAMFAGLVGAAAVAGL